MLSVVPNQLINYIMKSIILVAAVLAVALAVAVPKQYSPFVILSKFPQYMRSLPSASNLTTSASYLNLINSATLGKDQPSYYFEVESDVSAPQAAIK